MMEPSMSVFSRRFAFAALIALLQAALPAPALAIQIKTAPEGGTVTASISAHEVNRIAVQDDRIVRLNRTAGSFTYQHDPDKGDLYIEMEGQGTRPLTLFLTTEKGFTYKLILTPRDIPSEQVWIRNMKALSGSDAAREYEAKGEYKSTIVEIVKALALDAPLPGYSASTNVDFREPGEGLSAVIALRHEGDAFLGEQWLVKGSGDQAVPLDEKLFRATTGAIAVQLGARIVNPGEIVPIRLVYLKQR